ncbi:MAG: carboxylating nicotinate-nucleotide diphosphorylase [Candidatus Methanogranum gryphiswaldense]|nr:MAG: carboxylating nicotinate-nucleotide diphosphorylase [Candidatus Methanogranum sp. U3.2.1]
MIKDIKRFLEEDVGSGDITTEMFVPDRTGTASILCEEEAVIAGLEEAREVFEALGAECQLISRDGDTVTKNTVVMSIYGPLRAITTGERVALNILMRMSGIATKTARITNIIRTKDPHLMIAATRKTTPGFRYYEKKAVELGGGWPHRMGLYDMIMIKDNHIAACGNIENAMKKLKNIDPTVKVDVEVVSLEQGKIVAGYAVDIIMADHMSPEDTRSLKQYVNMISPKTKIEASGNITEDNVLSYAGCADIVSMGSLTHSVKAIDFSLDIDPIKN